MTDKELRAINDKISQAQKLAHRIEEAKRYIDTKVEYSVSVYDKAVSINSTYLNGLDLNSFKAMLSEHVRQMEAELGKLIR